MQYKLLQWFSYEGTDKFDFKCFQLPPGTIILLSEEDAKAGVEQGMMEEVVEEGTILEVLNVGLPCEDCSICGEAIGGVAYKDHGCYKKPSDWIEKEATDMLELNLSNPTLREQNIVYVNSIILFLDLLASSGQIKLPNLKDI